LIRLPSTALYTRSYDTHEVQAGMGAGIFGSVEGLRQIAEQTLRTEIDKSSPTQSFRQQPRRRKSPWRPSPPRPVWPSGFNNSTIFASKGLSPSPSTTRSARRSSTSSERRPTRTATALCIVLKYGALPAGGCGKHGDGDGDAENRESREARGALVLIDRLRDAEPRTHDAEVHHRARQGVRPHVPDRVLAVQPGMRCDRRRDHVRP